MWNLKEGEQKRAENIERGFFSSGPDSFFVYLYSAASILVIINFAEDFCTLVI